MKVFSKKIFAFEYAATTGPRIRNVDGIIAKIGD
jgi:hypothetical protein